jgi:hypothetical protein
MRVSKPAGVIVIMGAGEGAVLLHRRAAWMFTLLLCRMVAAGQMAPWPEVIQGIIMEARVTARATPIKATATKVMPTKAIAIKIVLKSTPIKIIATEAIATLRAIKDQRWHQVVQGAAMPEITRSLRYLRLLVRADLLTVRDKNSKSLDVLKLHDQLWSWSFFAFVAGAYQAQVICLPRDILRADWPNCITVPYF